MPVEDLASIYYDGDARRVHCGANIDDKATFGTDEILAALDRAAARAEVLELYAHKPGTTVSLERLERVLAHARGLGLGFYTYADLAARRTGAGLALAFDDRDTYGWSGSLAPLLATHGARVTFFVSGYRYFDDVQRAHIRQLADAGHDIAAHSVDHRNAPAYVEEEGLSAYLADEVRPSIDLLRADGYPVTSFAYPFGLRTSEIDAAILAHVEIVRGVDSPYTAAILGACP